MVEKILINDLCINCHRCIPYCPVEAIENIKGSVRVNTDTCVECGVCLRNSNCPVNAFEKDLLKWPRLIRSHFSDPASTHPATGLPGRGTSEMKTNDVTGRYHYGDTAISVEIGRPGVGTGFIDIEKISMALAEIGVDWEPDNPITTLFKDASTGQIIDDVKNESVLSAIIEFKISIEKTVEIFKCLESIQVNTVFCVSIITKVEDDGRLPNIEHIERLGYKPLPNPKVNVGLGKPLFIISKQ